MTALKQRVLATAFAAASAVASGAHAEPFQLTITGNFYTAPTVACFVPGFGSACNTTPASISGTPIPDGTPFTETALFDTSTTNLATALNIPGTAFYVPSQASIALGGVVYQITPYSSAVPAGASVAIFDPFSPFPSIPEYGVALIGNVTESGAGILADFTYDPSNFITVDKLRDFTFSGAEYVGTGIFSGTCTANCAVPSPPNQVNNIEPIPLTLNGKSYALTLPNNVLLNYALALNDPNTGNGFGTTITTPFTAKLVDVPEPRSILVIAGWLLGLVAVRLGGSSRPVRRGPTA